MISKFVKLIACVVLFFSLAVTSHAQSADEKAILTTMETMRVAMLKADTETLDKIVAPQLSYGHTNGMMENRAGFLGDIKAGVNKYLVLEWSDTAVTVDENIAYARHRMVSTYEGNGKQGSADIGVLVIWKKNGDKGWQVLARQAYKLPEAK